MKTNSAKGNGTIKGILLLSLLLLNACSDGGGASCGVERQNRILHQQMLDRYYWYDQVPTSIDYGNFSSAEETLDFLRYAALDRFSYITSQSAFDNLFNNGTYIGYGFGFFVEADGTVLVRFVYQQSVAASVGMVRGDEILSVNGQAVADIIASSSFGSVFGVNEIGVPLTIELRRSNNAVETLQMSKAVVTINTVLHSEVIVGASSTIGYLVFSSFLNTSLAELAPVFSQFKAAGVNQLILDLRYNGGGSVAVARDLASYVNAAMNPSTELYVELRFNDKHQSDNFEYYFKAEPNSLNLDDLTVITTDSSCSASEQVISALQPYLTRVTTVGGTTCGKPVGQQAFNFCEQTLLAVNFASFNADDQGEYFNGIPADCNVADDPRFAFGDSNEPMLSAARYFVDNQVCQPGTRQSPRSVVPLPGLGAITGAV